MVVLTESFFASLSKVCASSFLLLSDHAMGQQKTSGSSHCVDVCVHPESAQRSVTVRACWCVLASQQACQAKSPTSVSSDVF